MPNPKDYESTTEEGEDEEFLANDNFRGTDLNIPFSPSDHFKDTHGDEELNPPREEFESMGQDGEEFLLSQGYKSADDSCEMFSSTDDGKEIFQAMMLMNFLTMLRMMIVGIIFLLMVMKLLLQRMME